MKINIIGGSGFIGSELISLLKDDHQIRNYDKQINPINKQITTQVNICDSLKLDNVLESSDWVVHLAAEHKDNVTPTTLYYDVNVEGTRVLLNAMDKKRIKKIIFTSSVAVYGLNSQNADESAPINPFNDYGKSKYLAEKVLEEWYNQDKEQRTLIVIRPTVVFGPGNRGNVYNLLKQISSGGFLMIGDGENVKSMSYVGNITAFINHCIKSNLKGYHLFNYSDKPDLTMNELVHISRSHMNKKGKPIRMPYYIGYAIGVAFDVLAKLLNRKFSISSIRVKKFCANTKFSSINIDKTKFVAPFDMSTALLNTIQSITKKKH